LQGIALGRPDEVLGDARQRLAHDAPDLFMARRRRGAGQTLGGPDYRPVTSSLQP